MVNFPASWAMLVYRRVPHFYTLKYLGSEMVDPLWLIPKGLTPPVVEGIHFFLFSKFLFSYIFTYVDSFFYPQNINQKSQVNIHIHIDLMLFLVVFGRSWDHLNSPLETWFWPKNLQKGTADAMPVRRLPLWFFFVFALCAFQSEAQK